MIVPGLMLTMLIMPLVQSGLIIHYYLGVGLILIKDHIVFQTDGLDLGVGNLKFKTYNFSSIECWSQLFGCSHHHDLRAKEAPGFSRGRNWLYNKNK